MGLSFYIVSNFVFSIQYETLTHTWIIPNKFLVYQCVNSKAFNKISKSATTKDVWDILIKTYGDGDKNKKVKL